MHIPVIMAIWFALVGRRSNRNPWSWALWGAVQSLMVAATFTLVGFALVMSLQGKRNPFFVELARLGKQGLLVFVIAVSVISMAVTASIGHAKARGSGMATVWAWIFAVLGIICSLIIALPSR